MKISTDNFCSMIESMYNHSLVLKRSGRYRIIWHPAAKKFEIITKGGTSYRDTLTEAVEHWNSNM